MIYNELLLCKAKRKDNGEWIEGFYTEDMDIPSMDFLTEDGWITDIEVDPDTVCRYTGTSDNNNKKVFENDIVGHSLYGTGQRSVVTWRNGGFYLDIYPIGYFHSFRVHGNIKDK